LDDRTLDSGWKDSTNPDGVAEEPGPSGEHKEELPQRGRAIYQSSRGTKLARPGHSAAEGRSLQDPDTLVEYAYAKVDSGAWVSHAAGTYLTRISAGLDWLAIPRPDLRSMGKFSWLKKAFMRLRLSKGTKHRRPLSHARLGRICTLLGQAHGQNTPAAALTRLGFYGMLRTRELLTMKARNMKWRYDKKDQAWAIHLRFADKTHLAEKRVVAVAVTRSWEREAVELKRRWEAAEADEVLLTGAEAKALTEALRGMKRSVGCLRPGGNMFWLEAGLQAAVRHRQGGWSASSNVPNQHYTRVSRRLVRDMRRRAGRTSTLG